MRAIWLVCLTLSLSLPASAKQSPASALGPQGALFEQALAQAGLMADEMRLDMGDRSFWGGDKYRLPFFDALQADPWKVSPYTRKLGDMLLSQANDPATVLVSAQSRLNAGIRLGLTGDVLEPYEKRVKELGEDSLAVALSELEKYGGKTVKPETFKKLDYTQAPPELRDALALVVFVIPAVLEYRRQALVVPMMKLGLDPHETYERILNATLFDEQNDDVRGQLETTLLIEKLLDCVDFQLLNTGATLLALASKRAADKVAAVPADVADFQRLNYWVHTSFGLVSMGGETMQEPHLLTIAFRHQSTAVIGGVADFHHPVSVSITRSGDNTYHLGDANAGAGIFGYGIVMDLAGNDSYEVKSAGLGFGLFGVGLLYDAGGNDTYTSITNSQGCGIYGTGILIDAGGNDEYHAYQYGQGYGFTRGIGLLLDAGGDDIYDANDSDIRYGGPQTALHNTSMCQGMGNGRRGDYLDGHSWAGGVGMLIDGGGADRYSCGTFGQGCSYWYGTGMLVDKGDAADSYRGIWYVQGSGAHFGLSVLQDDGGNDTYWASHNMAQGAGHDWTLSWFEDAAGNDDYTAPNLSLGGANANGIGVFWDKAGDDVYRSQGVTLGAAGGVASPSLREFMLNLGLFVDGGGHDTYLEITKRDPEKPADPIETRPWDFAGDGKAWTRPGQSSPAVQQEYGVGVDAP